MTFHIPNQTAANGFLPRDTTLIFLARGSGGEHSEGDRRERPCDGVDVGAPFRRELVAGGFAAQGVGGSGGIARLQGRYGGGAVLPPEYICLGVRHVPTPPLNTEFNSDARKYGFKMRLSPKFAGTI